MHCFLFFLHQMERRKHCHRLRLSTSLNTSCSTGREAAHFPAIFLRHPRETQLTPFIEKIKIKYRCRPPTGARKARCKAVWFV